MNRSALIVFGGIAAAMIVLIVYLAVFESDTGGAIGKTTAVVMETSMGTVKMEIFDEKAPISAKNFLKYADTRHYDGTLFHRVIKDFMIQGGGFQPGMVERPTFPPIKNEAGNGLKNERGTLAMARTNDPNSATSQFFINVVENTFLNREEARDKVGYAVFGRVTEGMDVVDKIRNVTTAAQDIPIRDVVIKSIRRVEPE